MTSELTSILNLRVPIIVRIGERQLDFAEVLSLVPGSIIELRKEADSELDLLVNNRQIGLGSAVKVGENFGLRVSYIGDVRERIEAMSGQEPEQAQHEPQADEDAPGPDVDETDESAGEGAADEQGESSDESAAAA